jgi:hypothetical protein
MPQAFIHVAPELLRTFRWRPTQHARAQEFEGRFWFQANWKDTYVHEKYGQRASQNRGKRKCGGTGGACQAERRLRVAGVYSDVLYQVRSWAAFCIFRWLVCLCQTELRCWAHLQAFVASEQQSTIIMHLGDMATAGHVASC